MSNLYSPLKAAWHLPRVAELREGRQIAPVELQLIITDVCNHNCHFCAYRAEDGLSSADFDPTKSIETNKVKEILNDASYIGAKSVIFTGGGEPTAHPEHLALFRHALDLGLDCALNTNGTLFRLGWETVLPYFAYVRFSIDAGTDEEYSRIRGVKLGQYWKALSNMKDLSDSVKLHDTACVVGAGYVVTPENYENLMGGIQNIRDSGATYVRLAAMQSTKGYDAFGGHLGAARAMCKKAEELSTDDFNVVNLFDGVMDERPDYDFCGMQQYVTYIGANLKVYRCCYTAYTQLGEIGDLSKQSFVEWFYSGAKKKAIREFSAKSCNACPLTSKNEVINYMAGKEPPHINFV